jgi:transposase
MKIYDSAGWEPSNGYTRITRKAVYSLKSMEAYQKGTSKMFEMFLSAGIDVGADFSFMSIALPNQSFAGKPVKITHADLKSLERAARLLRESEEKYGLGTRIFLESTSIYHYSLTNYFSSKGFNVSVINPIITKSSATINIRKVENDKTASQKIALIGLNPKLKTSSLPGEFVLNLRNLVREYYYLVDSRSAYITKLAAILKTAFPRYIGIFSKLTTETSLRLLEKYTSPQAFMKARKSSVVKLIRTTSRSGQIYAEEQYAKIIQAAKDALVLGYAVPSHFELIKSHISFIRIYNQQIAAILASMQKFADDNSDELFVKQIRLIETIKGAGFLSAATLMAEIGDFSAFNSPKQLFAYFGLDPSVKRSGNFIGTKNKMSKRGSAIARRVIHTISTVSIAKTRAGSFNNPVLRQYYDDKCNSKPKLVALGAVAHKVCNIIFAVLRDNKPFSVISKDEHIKEYQRKFSELA